MFSDWITELEDLAGSSQPLVVASEPKYDNVHVSVAVSEGTLGEQRASQKPQEEIWASAKLLHM